MKKILSLVLALMMVLSMANVAFAAPEDVTDKNQQKAVDALISLGIVKGYEDGSYKPEKVVTRAELAKMLVEALGQGDLVAGSESSFKDAKGTWYDGYVALAAGLELVTGYPDGTFKGDNSVSYQEAVVMVLRALGYTNQTVNGGIDAYNATKYKTLAQTLGLLSNVTFKAGGANRGDIASMIYNALEVERVEKTEKGLAQKIVIDKEMRPVAGTGTSGDPYLYKEFPVYETLLDKLTNRTEITVSPASLDPTNKAYRGNMVDLEPYMYQKVVTYLNGNGHVMFVKSNKTATVKGSVSPMRTTDIQWVNDTAGTIVKDKVIVTKADKVVERVQWDGATTINVYYNGAEMTGATKAMFQYGGTFHGQAVTLVLDANGKVVAAIATKANDSVQIASSYKAGSVKVGTINLPKTAANKVDLTKITVKGEVTDIADIVKGDVVTVYYAAGNSSNPAKVVLDVCRDTVEGKITKIATDGGLVINGDAYYEYDSDITGLALGAEGVFYLNSDEEIVAFAGKSISNADYALVTSVKTGSIGGTPTVLLKEASIKLLNKEGKSTTYNFASNAKYTLDAGTELSVFVNPSNGQQQLVQDVINFRANNFIVTGFNLNDNGQITLISVETLVPRTGINPTSKVFAATDDVVIFNAYDSANPTSQSAPTASDTFSVAKVEDLIKNVNKTYYAVLNARGEFALIIADEQLLDNSQYALIRTVESELTSNGIVQRVTAYVKGEQVEYLTAAGVNVNSAVGTRNLIKLPLANGVISQTVTTSAAFVVTPIIQNVAVDGTLNVNDRRLAKGATIYVFTQSTATYGYSFSRVGDESDLLLDNAEFKLYDLDNDLSNGYEVVIISVHR